MSMVVCVLTDPHMWWKDRRESLCTWGRESPQWGSLRRKCLFTSYCQNTITSPEAQTDGTLATKWQNARQVEPMLCQQPFWCPTLTSCSQNPADKQTLCKSWVFFSLAAGGLYVICRIVTCLLTSPPGVLEPRQLPADLRLRGQDGEAMGRQHGHGRHHLQHGQWCHGPAAGMPVAEGPPYQRLPVGQHQLPGQEQPRQAPPRHQGVCP